MDLSNIKFLVVGSGFFGATVAERIANDLGRKVLVIDKRNHIGGNCYSLDDEGTGIHYHQYGTHIFHTSNEKVWNYINRFTGFNSYRHQVLTTYNNKVYQMPINLETINSFYNLNLKPYEVDAFLKEEISKENIGEPGNFEEKAIRLIGRRLYEALIRGYTYKQWSKDPKELPANILTRLPFRKNYNENYYNSRWHGIPSQGYTEIFKKMLTHKNIEVLLNTDFMDIRNDLPEDTLVVYSGPIDCYFDFKFGKLEWRTLLFNKEVLNVEDYQGTSVMNYSEVSIPYTRIHEPRHLHPEKEYTKEKTLIIKEYPKLDDGTNPYYPINDKRNQDLLLKYLKLSEKLPNVIIGGRLGEYKYHDMHDTINRALEHYEKIIKPKYC